MNYSQSGNLLKQTLQHINGIKSNILSTQREKETEISTLTGNIRIKSGASGLLLALICHVVRKAAQPISSARAAPTAQTFQRTHAFVRPDL